MTLHKVPFGGYFELFCHWFLPIHLVNYERPGLCHGIIKGCFWCAAGVSRFGLRVIKASCQPICLLVTISELRKWDQVIPP